MVVVAADEFRRLKVELSGADLMKRCRRRLIARQTSNRGAHRRRCARSICDRLAARDQRSVGVAPRQAGAGGRRIVGAQQLDLLYVSAVTLAEFRFGVERLPDAARRAEPNEWLAHKVRPMFEQRILPVSEDVMFMAAARRRGPQSRAHVLPT